MIYEVRTYTLRPSTVPEFEERFAKRKPLREKHSSLGAFWHTDFGPLNQVIHAWPYDNLQHRTAVREAMASDRSAPGNGPGGLTRKWPLATPLRQRTKPERAANSCAT